MKDIKVGEIYTFKLTSGEEVVAKVTELLENNWISITSPASIMMMQSGNPGMGPSLITQDITVSVALNTSNVVMVVLTDEAIRTKYIEATTGLTLPDKKVLLG